jgi:hypothetical protein
MQYFNDKICFKRNGCFRYVDEKNQAKKELASRGPKGDCFNEQIRMINGMLGIYKCL